jgi:hypothetical protein
MPGRLEFLTTPDGSATPTERARIDASGNMQVSTGQFTVGTTGSSGIQMINDGTFGTINSAALTIRTNATTAMTVDTSQRLLIGRTSSQNDNIGGTGYANLVQIEGDAIGAGLGVANTANAGRINITRDITSDNITNGMTLGQLSFGSESPTSVERARIQCNADFTSSNERGGTLKFYTSSDGAHDPSERLRITNTGAFLFNNGLMRENGNVNTTARTGTQDVDLNSGMVHYFTASATGTWKPNFVVTSSGTGDINDHMNTGDVISPTMIVNKSNTAHYADSVQVDGSDRTIEWLNGAPTAGGGNNTFDVYNYTIIKTGDDTFIVFGSVSTYE